MGSLGQVRVASTKLGMDKFSSLRGSIITLYLKGQCMKWAMEGIPGLVLFTFTE